MAACFRCALQLTIPGLIFYAGVVTAQRYQVPQVPTPADIYREATGEELPSSPTEALQAAQEAAGQAAEVFTSSGQKSPGGGGSSSSTVAERGGGGGGGGGGGVSTAATANKTPVSINDTSSHAGDSSSPKLPPDNCDNQYESIYAARIFLPPDNPYCCPACGQNVGK